MGRLALLLLLGCSEPDPDVQRDSPPPSKRPGPEFLAAPVAELCAPAPLAATLEVETDLPTAISVQIAAGEEVWSLVFDAVQTEHRLSVRGLLPDTAHALTVTATAADGAATTWPEALDLRTDPLPPWFPSYTVRVSDPDRMEPGLTLLSAGPMDLTDPHTFAAFFDAWGRVRWYQVDPRGETEVRPMRNGNLIYGRGRTEIVEHDLCGGTQRVWHTRLHDTPEPGSIPLDFDAAHHTVVELPSGNFLLFTVEIHSDPAYPTSAEVQGSTAPAEVAGDAIIEMEPTGAVVHRFAMRDLLDPHRIGYDSVDSPWWSDFLGTEAMDWTHGNALDYDEDEDAIIASLRHQDAVVKLSRGTGALQWILAPPVNWSPELADKVLTPTEPSPRHAYHQHGAKRTPEGTVIMWDNGNHQASAYEPRTPGRGVDSRAVEFAVDPVAGTRTELWSWSALDEPNFSLAEGDATALPETGNVLISTGMMQRSQVVEVQRTSGSDVVFHLEFGLWETHVYRAMRVPSLYWAGGAHRQE